MIDSLATHKIEQSGNSLDIEDLTLEEAEVVAAGISAFEALVIGGFIVFGAAIVIL